MGVTLRDIDFDRREMAILLANMIEAFLAADGPPSPPEEVGDEQQGHPATPPEGGVHLHQAVDDGPDPPPPGEYPEAVRPAGPGGRSGLADDEGEGPGPGPGDLRGAGIPRNMIRSGVLPQRFLLVRLRARIS